MKIEDEIRRLLFSAEPHFDESFIGYLLRLMELNDYDTLSWITQLARIRNFARGGYGFCLNPALDLSPLSELTGVNRSKLSALFYHPAGPIRARLGNYLIFGQVVPRYVIRTKHPKVCPACLKESGYARKVWELSPVTCCPVHKCLLLDECPNCSRRISWLRQGLSRCRCGFNWRKHTRYRVEERELEVTRQIYRLCNLPVDPATGQSGIIRDSPLHNLKLQPFLSALFLIGSQYEGFVDTKGKHIGPSKKNAEVHRLLCKALIAFEGWPESFYSFLNHIREGAQHKSRSWGIQRDFQKFDYALHVQLPSKEFEFMRDAFKEYLLTRWEGGRASCLGRLSESARCKAKYVTRVEAMAILGVAHGAIDLHIAHGRLKGIVRDDGGGRKYLIERSSVVELKRELEQAMYLKQVASFLGLYGTRVMLLVNAGLLNPISGPAVDGYGDWLFSGREVEGLLTQIRGRIKKPVERRDRDIIDFSKVVKRLVEVGVGLPELIRAILNGEICPSGEDEKVKGLRRFVFPEQEVSEYLWARVRESAKDSYLVSELPEILGLTRNAVYSLVREGVIPAQQTANVLKSKMLVTKENLDSFVASHVMLSNVASKLKTDTGFLARLLIKKEIRPVSGPGVDGGQRYVFRKSDLKSVNMARLIVAARKQAALRRKEPQTVGLDCAAKILSVDVETVRQLVENGVLTTYRNAPRKNGAGSGMYFSTHTVKKYRDRVKEYVGLVTVKVAAKMTGLSVSGLLVTYVQKGRLRAHNPKGKSKPHYFKKEDVEALAAVRKQTLTSPQVAAKLGVNITCVHKQKLSGILKPVSGPDVDGFPFNLYLREDVERLCTEREAFKAKCIKEGKTSRFGRQAGPKVSPVRDMIGPRIDQLIEEWQKKTPNKRITGQRLYQQLIDEGYQLGVVTVYEYLRQKHPKAA